MAAPDEAPAEQAAWADFRGRLGDLLAAQWPVMAERLGERYEVFVALAVDRASRQGLSLAAAVARYVNLCFVWGPDFHDKPGFEWALAIMTAAREREWLLVHQLVQRSLIELERLPGSRIEPALLAAADARLLDCFEGLGSQGRMHPPESPALARRACDLEALELRAVEETPAQLYRLADGEWQRAPAPPPPQQRIGAGHAAPALLALLSRRTGPRTGLQLRVRTHAVCSAPHPAAHFFGPHGRWSWFGSETFSCAWPVATREQPAPPAGAGAFVAEETSPEPQRLDIECCGLRDEGEPLGAQKLAVSVWPGEQWWIEITRSQASAQALLPGAREFARAPTRCRLERDGQALDGTGLAQLFAQGLDAQVAAAAQRLGAAWQGLAGLEAASFEATLGLLVGRASATWGWQYGAGGLDGEALMRLVAAFEMDACVADLQFGGRLACGTARGRIAVRVGGTAALRATLRRETAQPTVAELMQGARATWRLPFTVALDPLAGDDAGLVELAGPSVGALVGEAGLRPCSKGRSGWEWFAALRLEAVSVPLHWVDPLLGEQCFVQPLFDAAPLVDWSLG